MSFKFRYFAFLLAGSAVLLPLTACSGGDDKEPDGGGTGGSSTPYWTITSTNENMPSAGTLMIDRTDSPVSCDISKLVDGDVETKFRTNHKDFSVTFNGNNATAVTSYSLTSASDAKEADPKAWTLEGSADNRSWKTLDTRSGESFSGRKETRTFALANDKEYRYYRLRVTDNNGAAYSQLAEFSLSAETGEGENVDDIIAKAKGHTHSAKCPLGTVHENDLTATQDDIEWLKDPNKEPNTFGGLSWRTFDITNIYPFGEPKPADVNQHSIGNCCALAVLAEMAYLYPKYIRSIIKSGDNNTYTVTLFDPKGNKVEVGVDNYFVADNSKLGACSGKTDNVTWATVIEKAIIKWCQVYKGSSDIGGIATEYVAAILTGNGDTYSFRPGDITTEELRRAVISLLKQRQLVIGGFQDGDKPVDGKYKTVNFHAYSFSLPSSSKYVYVMRNPWGLLPQISGGYSDGKEDGLLNIENDGVIPEIVDIRVCNPGAAKQYAEKGSLMPYTPPSYMPAPMHINIIPEAIAPVE